MNNQSKAESFQVNSKYEKGNLTEAEFLANINTSAQFDKPHYSQPAFIPIKEDYSVIHLALRTQATIAILKIENFRVDILYQMIFAESFIRKNKIACFEFVQQPLANGDEKLMLVGFKSGLIIEVDYLTTNFLNNFNIINEKSNEPWKKQSVTKICMIPHKQQFLAVFQDSTLLKFQMGAQQHYNQQLFEEIQKIEENLSFDQFILKYKQQRKKKDFYEAGSISNIEEFKSFSMLCIEQNQNPVAYFRFKCNSITDLVVLSPQNYAYGFVNQEQHDPLVIAFTGLDGYFRLLDIQNLKPIYLFKSNYGGINSLVFESPTSPIVGLSCQDDSTIILNIETQFYIRIQNQTSFISRTIFKSIGENVMRVISASYDGSIGIKEFFRNELQGKTQKSKQDEQFQKDSNQQQLQQQNNKIETVGTTYTQNKDQNISQNKQKEDQKSIKLPIIQQYDKNVSVEVQNDQTLFVNREGLGCIDLCGNVMITSSFDGCCSIWEFKNEVLNDQNSKQQILSQKQIQNQSSIQEDQQQQDKKKSLRRNNANNNQNQNNTTSSSNYNNKNNSQQQQQQQEPDETIGQQNSSQM